MPRKAPPHAWTKGTSGNPKGRPKGSGEIGKLRAAIGERLPEIIERLTAQALAGDVGAARLLIERAIPPVKAAEQPAPVSLPGDSLSERGRSIIAALERGELAPGQAASLMSALAALGRTIETDELLRRIEALEAARGVA